VIRLAVHSALAVALSIITVVTVFVCWSGYRVTSAINHGALRAVVHLCSDARHLVQRKSGQVPQKMVDRVLARQIWGFYYNNPKRKLSHHIILQSSWIGWETFWSPDDRRQIYLTLERRMRPCPGAIKHFREWESNRRA
jgi:hypothetical protein